MTCSYGDVYKRQILLSQYLCQLLGTVVTVVDEDNNITLLDSTVNLRVIDWLCLLYTSLSASAQAIIDKQGVAYTDIEGDLVTSIVNGGAAFYDSGSAAGGRFCAGYRSTGFTAGIGGRNGAGV